MNLKDLMLLLAAISLSLLLAYFGLKAFAPQLLGAPTDLKLVKIEERSPAFYENVFHALKPEQTNALVNDPYTGIRAQPFYPETLSWGPNDLLGFRNRFIPVAADILIIGDSQTYGNNVFLQDNWPEQLRELFRLSDSYPSIYSMATGGWGATQYLNMMQYAVQFKPNVVVVAYYTGNDPMDSFMSAYANDKWKWLRADDSLTVDDAPALINLANNDKHWKVEFKNGVSTVFIPELRDLSNRPSPVVDAGYKVMEQTAAQITAIARQHNIKPVFILIPTKEYVYAEKLVSDGVEASDAYQRQVKNEQMRIDQFTNYLKSLDGAVYVDVISGLRSAAEEDKALYPNNVNGHPIEEGYLVIAKGVFSGIYGKIISPPIEDGLVVVKFSEDEYAFAIKKKNTIRYFSEPGLSLENGWEISESIKTMDAHELKRYWVLPRISEVNSKLYGPDAQD